MKKVLSYGISVDRNFGGPSLVAGLHETLKILYGDTGFSLVHYQWNKPNRINEDIIGSRVKEFPYSGIYVLKDWIKIRLFNVLPKNPERVEFWQDYKAADVIYNIYGICFCARLRSSKRKSIPFIGYKSAITCFALNVMARCDRKISVKGSASYGPIEWQSEKDAAKISEKFIFDRMLAREIESAKQMRDAAGIKREIPVAPDVANMMPFPKGWNNNGMIGFSVSFQIIKQWEGFEDYIDVMARMISYGHETTGCAVMIFPNELKWNGEYDDNTVALEIKNKIPRSDDWLRICDAGNISGLELKNMISSCSVVVAARYHTCVAALSSGVPTLVIGWHYKYKELLELYGQVHRMIPTKACKYDMMKSAFDDLWSNRIEIHKLLLKRGEVVRRRVVDSVKYLIETKDGNVLH